MSLLYYSIQFDYCSILLLSSHEPPDKLSKLSLLESKDGEFLLFVLVGKGATNRSITQLEILSVVWK